MRPLLWEIGLLSASPGVGSTLFLNHYNPIGGEVMGSGNGMSRYVILNAEILGNAPLRVPPLGLMVWQLYIQHLAVHPTGQASL